MKNVIVGTSGHVDHGKTCLIKALTGVDTDRLKEEKKRGITIELGFANLQNDRDLRIGIIDVPGHEKFVRNMLAGIGGIDVVLLVIGLDEGVMPQTVEHFEIIKSIGIKDGIIVFTKSDIAEEGMYDLVQEDVSNLVKGSFLENAPRIRVSAYTGENIDVLKQMILDKASKIVTRRETKELFRLPVDRVFTIEGFGTVVTGTLMEGSVSANDEVQVYPSGKVVKVRQVQSHNNMEQGAVAGQRTALNLAGISKEELQRGEVLAYPDSLLPSERLDVDITLFKSTKRKLKNGDRVHINYGSNQAECRVVLLDKTMIKADEKAYAQLVFDSPVPVKRGDKFIIRFLSPVETFGGGHVLAVSESKHKRNDSSVIAGYDILASEDMEKITDYEILKYGFDFQDVVWLGKKLNLSVAEADKILDKLYKDGRVIKLKSSSVLYIHKSVWNDVIEYSNIVLNEFHGKNEILPGIPKEEFKQILRKKYKTLSIHRADILLESLISKNRISQVEGAVAALGFAASYSSENRTMLDDIEKKYREAGIQVPDTSEVMSSFKDQNLARQMINDLNKKGKLIKINNNAYIYREFFDSIVENLRKYFKSNKELTLAQFRDMYSTSRKYALLVLEFCDYRGYTKKTGDVRISLFKD